MNITRFMALPTLAYFVGSVAMIVVGFLFSEVLRPGAPLLLRVLVFATSVCLSVSGLSGIAQIYDATK